jgi:hypothetical protein
MLFTSWVITPLANPDADADADADNSPDPDLTAPDPDPDPDSDSDPDPDRLNPMTLASPVRLRVKAPQSLIRSLDM